MKISGSMQRRILYYYVPAKFRSLFSFCCSQRAHNLLSTMRRATKLHCCSANRLVLVDGLTRCEVCLSAAAAAAAAEEGSLGTPSPPQQAQRKRKERTGGKKRKKRGVKQQATFLVSVYFSPFRQGNSLAGEEAVEVVVLLLLVSKCLTYNIQYVPLLVDNFC